MDISELAKKLEPFFLRVIATAGVTPIGAAYAPDPHPLSSTHHTGLLIDSQGPQFLLIDGTRTLNGNLAVASNVTIDGIDISAHAANAAAHHVAFTGLLDNANTVVSVDGNNRIKIASGDGIDTVAGTNLITITVDVSDILGVGITEDGSNNIVLGTPSTLNVSSTNSVSGTTHSHAITSSSNPGAAASILATDANGGIALDTNLLVASGSLNTIGIGVAAPTGYRVDIREGTNKQLKLSYSDAIFGELFQTASDLKLHTTSGRMYLNSSATLGSFWIDIGESNITNDTQLRFRTGSYTASLSQWSTGEFQVNSNKDLRFSVPNPTNDPNAYFRWSFYTTSWQDIMTLKNDRSLILNGTANIINASANPQMKLSYDGSNYMNVTIDINGNATMAPTGDLLLDPTGNDVVPVTNYDISLGSPTKKYLSLYAAELIVTNLVAANVLSTIGGRVVVAPTTIFTTDVAAGDTTIYVKHNSLVNNDTIYCEGGGQVEFMRITSGPSGVGPYSYTVTRNLDGTGANAWIKGDAVLNTRQAGHGFIDLYATTGISAPSAFGPTLVGNVRLSQTYNDWTEHFAIGNLNGVYGYSATAYGAAFGKYDPSASYLTIDDTNGIRFMAGAVNIAKWAMNGDITIGEVNSSKSNVIISSGGLSIRNNTTTLINLASTGILTVGEVGSGKSNVLISSGAVSIRNNVTEIIGLTSAGVLTVGEVAVSKSNVLISSGALSIRNNTTERIGLDASGILTIKDSGGNAVFTFNASTGAEFTKALTLGVNGGIYQGTGTFSSPTTGLKIYSKYDAPDYFGSIAGYNGGVEQWSVGSDGYIHAGSILIYKDVLTVPGCVNLTTNGNVNVTNSTYIMWDGSTSNSIINTKAASGEYSMQMLVTGQYVSNLRLKSDGGSGKIAELYLNSFGTSGLTLPTSYPTLSITGGITTSSQYQRNSTAGCIFVPLNPFVMMDTTGNSWNGSLSRNTGTYPFDMQDVNNGSIPSAAKAIAIRMSAIQTAGGSNFVGARARGSSNTNYPVGAISLSSTISTSSSGIVNLDATNSDIEIIVGGANATGCYAICYGYFI